MPQSAHGGRDATVTPMTRNVSSAFFIFLSKSACMNALSQPDRQHLQAAEGWLELGNWLEANEELDRIEAKMRAHPDVLFMRARVYAAAGKWPVVLELVDAVTNARSKKVEAWLLWARAYEELGEA